MTLPRLAVATSMLAALGGCREAPKAVFTELTQARRLAADLRVQFNKAVDASNRAVMADTDEASVGFAREAGRLKGYVSFDVEALTSRLLHLDEAAAAKSLEAFARQFAEYDKVDREVLELAGENTNLKAQRLSFGPLREAADAFRDSLRAAAASVRDRCRADELAAAGVIAVRETQVLFAPHIAEREDAVMTHIEKDMADRDAKARDVLERLAGVVDAKGKAALASAAAALERFASVSKEIVTLSRRNSNVRSIDLSLRRVPSLTGACDESLRALEEALAKNPFPATR